MALQAFANQYGTIITPYPQLPTGVIVTGSPNSGTIDAAGESQAAIGYVLLSTGPGTSKVISSSGGKIHWKTGAITFANGTTNLRIGIQDVAATGLEDGTYDVRGDLVGGTDTITANVVMSTAMETGSKTIAHGDLIAVVIEMTARGGADSVVVGKGSSNGLVPYGTADVGSGPVRNAQLPAFTIEFDDGTVGWFTASSFVSLVEASPALNTGTTPDEVALIFRLPFPAQVAGLLLAVTSVAAADDFEGILYTDPLGTPAAAHTLTQDSDLTSAAGALWDRPLSSLYSVTADTDYAVALRPTTANSINYTRLNFNTSNGVLRKPTMLGTNWSLGTRSNQTGAFTPDTTILPLFGVWLASFDDAVSTGGGLLRHPGMRGGLNA